MPTTPRSRQAIAFSAMISLSSNGNARSRQNRSPGFTGYSSVALSMPRIGGRDDVVEVLLAAPVPLHRVEAELRGGDVVLAVGPADDLVDGALDGDRARLDELRPVEQLQVAVEALRAPRVDRDQVAELPVVAGGQLDALGVGDRPHDGRGDGRPQVAVELGEGDLAAEGGGHRPKDSGAGDRHRPAAAAYPHGGARFSRRRLPGPRGPRRRAWRAGAGCAARRRAPGPGRGSWSGRAAPDSTCLKPERQGLVASSPRTRRGGSSARGAGGRSSGAGTGRS